jgi:hypothetical protein
MKAATTAFNQRTASGCSGPPACPSVHGDGLLAPSLGVAVSWDPNWQAFVGRMAAPSLVIAGMTGARHRPPFPAICHRARRGRGALPATRVGAAMYYYRGKFFALKIVTRSHLNRRLAADLPRPRPHRHPTARPQPRRDLDRRWQGLG